MSESKSNRSAEKGDPIGQLRITIVSHIFYPDELGGAALMTDLAKFLKEAGHEVNVVSTFPYYPRWKLAPEDMDLWLRDDVVGGIPMRRVRMYVPDKASTVKRLLSDISFLFSLTFLGRKCWRHADVMVTTCPMFGQTLAMRFATPFRHVPKLVIVQDFVVDAALELGMIRIGWLGAILKALERWAFRSCGTLTTISEEMLTKLNQIVGPGRRTLLVPNWIHGSLADAILRRKQNAGARPIGQLFYSGNVGRKQGLPEFLKMFEGNESDWTLKINGTGAEFDDLKTACATMPRVQLQGLQDEDKYIDSLLGCSACLVTQKPGVGANFLPSKILPALATGTPILAVCEVHSPLGREVIESDCGVVVPPGDTALLASTLRTWSEFPELLARFSKNAFARATRFKRSHVLTQYLNEIFRLAQQSQGIGCTPFTATNSASPIHLPAALSHVQEPSMLASKNFPTSTPSFLIIGGSGFIGRNLAVRLRRLHPQARIVVADLQEPLPAPHSSTADFVQCDVRKNIAAQIGQTSYDCIYNLAAIHREPGHAEQEYYDTNIQGANNVCAYAEVVGCNRIVFSSSIAVYGVAPSGTDESAHKHPATAYGITKLMAEGIHEKWQRNSPGRILRIIRPGVVYGPGDTGNVLRLIRAVKKGYFFLPGDPGTRKSFAYIDGLLDSIEFAEGLPDPVFVYNYVEKETLPIKQLVSASAHMLGCRTPVIRVPLTLLIPLAHLIQWITRGQSPIHPIRVYKAGVSTWIIPQALIDRGFRFNFDFQSSLHDWKKRAPEDFQ